MKLVDKMLLLTRMLRDNKQYTMDIETLVQTHQSYWQDQKRFWKNNLHQQELDRICQDIRDLKQEYDQALARANIWLISFLLCPCRTTVIYFSHLRLVLPPGCIFGILLVLVSPAILS